MRPALWDGNEKKSGTQVDTNKWNFYGENYWDKVSHFTKETTTVSGGLARLRFEKKRGHHDG